MLVIPWARLFCGSCPILISGIGAAWTLGFISAIIPFAVKGTRGLARAVVSGPEEDLRIEFNPAVQPGHTVNVVLRGFNPQSSIYQWSTELLADGEDPVRYLGPTLRLNVYQQDPYR